MGVELVAICLGCLIAVKFTLVILHLVTEDVKLHYTTEANRPVRKNILNVIVPFQKESTLK